MRSSRYHTTLLNRMLARMRRQRRGQSFVELMLVVMILGVLLAGVVEFGFMLNQYLHVVDGAREGARYSSVSEPFVMNSDGSIATNPPPPAVGGAIVDYLPFYYITAAKVAETMDPVILNPALNPAAPDDIVISVFSVDSGNLPIRFPLSEPNGWSLCKHYAAFAAYFPTIPPVGTISVPKQLSDPSWNSCGAAARISQFTASAIQNLMDPSAPNTGVLLVETYYNYPQLLKLLDSNGFMGVTYSIIPDPIPLYAYSVMPLSSAQPTQVPTPGP